MSLLSSTFSDPILVLLSIVSGGGKADLANGSLPVAAEGSTESPDAFLQQVLAYGQEYAAQNQL